MKTTILKSTLFIALFAGALSSCVKDDYNTPQVGECTGTNLVANREVSDIAASSVVAQHESITAGVPDVIEAYVTSSDIGGNFFKSISFQTLDGSKAFSIPVDAYSTFVNYEPGRKVLIDLTGLYTDIKDGGMRIGGLYNNSSGGAEVGRLPYAEFVSKVQPSCTKVDESELVQHVSVQQAIANDNYINKLVEFDNVEISNCDAFTTWYDPNNEIGGATNHLLVAKNGSTVILRISSFSNFASKAVATGSGTVRGVLTKYGTDFQFMPRAESDIDLTGARFTPNLNEGFAAGLSPCTGFTTFSVSGSEIWSASSSFGNPGPSVVISGYTGGNHVNEDWLISPSQDLSGAAAAQLIFDSSYKYTGNPIQVLISNNYTDGDPTAAGVTWTTLTGMTLSPGNFVWTNSGPVDITAFTGTGNSNVHVAFKYTSTTSGASTWEIDNIKIVTP